MSGRSLPAVMLELAPVALLLLALHGQACRDYDACGPGLVPCEVERGGAGGAWSLDGGAGGDAGVLPTGGRAGDSGEVGGAGTHSGGAVDNLAGSDALGGAPGGVTAESCDAPWFNCDGSTLNGCEDTRQSVEHCGACDTPCNGLCVGGVCQVFEIFKEEVVDPEGNIALSPAAVYYFASGDSAIPSVLGRISRDNAVLSPIAINFFSSVETLLVGATRLYIIADGGFWSAPLAESALAGEELRDEQLDVDAIAATAEYLYFSAGSRVYRRQELGGAPVELVHDFIALGDVDVELSGSREGVYAAAKDSLNDRYELVLLDLPDHVTPIEAGSGSIVALAAATDGVYFIRELEGTRLLRYGKADRETEEVEDAQDITAIAPARFGVYMSVDPARSHVLRYVEPAGVGFTWETLGAVLLPVNDAATEELWFVDGAQDALVRAKPLQLGDR